MWSSIVLVKSRLVVGLAQLCSQQFYQEAWFLVVGNSAPRAPSGDGVLGATRRCCSKPPQRTALGDTRTRLEGKMLHEVIVDSSSVWHSQGFLLSLLHTRNLKGVGGDWVGDLVITCDLYPVTPTTVSEPATVSVVTGDTWPGRLSCPAWSQLCLSVCADTCMLSSFTRILVLFL